VLKALYNNFRFTALPIDEVASNHRFLDEELRFATNAEARVVACLERQVDIGPKGIWVEGPGHRFVPWAVQKD
jgi:hypothetical protein